jgi:acyl-CoA thioesterase FadM
MPRIKIEMPQHFTFTTELPVRISDINYGGHLSNDSIVSLIHEARVRFLAQYNYGELNVEGVGMIMTDSAVIYKAEGFHGDILQIDFYYLLSNKKTAVEVAHAKTGMVFFDYTQRKVTAVPQKFRDRMMKTA